MLNPHRFKIIPDPNKLSVADVFELLRLRKAPKQPGVYELWIGIGKNHPARVFQHKGEWVNWTIQHHSKDSVFEYLISSPEAFNQLKKDFPYDTQITPDMGHASEQ
jgi:hypothetical protein